jgi:hypothetical protein
LGAIRKQKGRWVVKKKLPRQMQIFSDGQEQSIVIGKYHYASKLGRHMNAVKVFLRTNDPEHLRPFIGKSIKDKDGNIYVFETDPNALYRISASGTQPFEQIYRIVI